jgi:uncharacterized membrane protein
MSIETDATKEKSDYTLTTVIYACYAGGILTGGFSSLVGIVMNYVKKDELTNPMLQSHFLWQMRTFWYSLLWGIIGGILCVVFVGFFILFADMIWFIYRIVKGWIRLNENKSMYVD